MQSLFQSPSSNIVSEKRLFVKHDITADERRAFVDAVARWCGCDTDELGEIVGALCPGHAAQAAGDGWLARLCFVRTLYAQLKVEERSYGKPRAEIVA